MLVGVVVLVVAVGAGMIRGWPGWLPNISNPFAERTIDRSGPVLLRSIQDLSRYTAASGNFEVIIDVETGRRFIPDFLVSERILFVAAGSVDAYVDFSGLTDGAVVVDEAGNSVEISLPAPELAPANIDHERSYVYAVQRGVANRVRDFFADDPDQQQELFRLAEARIADAATDSELAERAEINTRLMLEGLLGSLGFDIVTITFAADQEEG